MNLALTFGFVAAILASAAAAAQSCTTDAACSPSGFCCAGSCQPQQCAAGAPSAPAVYVPGLQEFEPSTSVIFMAGALIVGAGIYYVLMRRSRRKDALRAEAEVERVKDLQRNAQLARYGEGTLSKEEYDRLISGYDLDMKKAQALRKEAGKKG